MMAGYNHLAEKLRIASRIDVHRAEIEKHRDWCDYRHDLITGWRSVPRPCDCEETGEQGRNRHLNPHVRRALSGEGRDPRITREISEKAPELTDDNLRGARDSSKIE